MPILSVQFLGNALMDWLKAILLSTVVFFMIKLLKTILISKFSTLAEKTKHDVDDIFLKIIEQTKDIIVLFICIYFGTQVLTLGEGWNDMIAKIFYIVLALQIGFWLGGVINFLVASKMQRETDDQKEQTAVHAFGLFGKIVIWVIVGLVAVQNITGMNLDALIASIGIGGIAIGLAVQNILKDIFASLSIFLDKPFLVGDYIVVDQIGGTVENIGIKSTRIRTLLGEEVVFTNSDLLESRVHNYRKLERRREVMKVGVSTETPIAMLEKLPGLFENAISKQEYATFDRAHLTEFADYTFMYEIVYFIESASYVDYMDTKQAVHLEILRQLNDQKVVLPYPTHMIIQSK